MQKLDFSSEMMILNKQKVKPKSNFDTSIVSVWLKDI
jgi:hypothetical protein